MRTALLQTDLPGLKLAGRGKVRDIYDLGDQLLIVATDRISAFDCVMPNGIPLKGRILTALSQFWFDLLSPITDNHLITADVDEMGPAVEEQADLLRGRTMLVEKAEVVPIECVVRGYLAGSGWREYQASGTVCGVSLPADLLQAAELPEPIFTPATKAESGHDENISFDRVVDLVGKDVAETLRAKSLDLYRTAREYAREKGLILSDTKFEWGFVDGNLLVVDEVLTPDSSRFWPAATYEPGREQASFDKQFVRDYLETCDWDKEPPAPALPDDVVAKTTEKYLDALRRLTGKGLDAEAGPTAEPPG